MVELPEDCPICEDKMVKGYVQIDPRPFSGAREETSGEFIGKQRLSWEVDLIFQYLMLNITDV